MYSVSVYGAMMADETRMNAYVAAMRQAITANSVVMDLGAGPGIFALIACQLGARLVYVVEPENIIQVARESSVANGFTDRIVCLQDFSTKIQLSEQPDIIVSDLRGVLPFFQRHLPSICDARDRLLSRGGTLIPHKDRLWAAIVEFPERYSALVGPWENNKFGMKLDAGRRLVTNGWFKARVKPEQLLTEPTLWWTLDYYQVDSPDVTAEFTCIAKRSGIAHGFAVWFDSELLGNIGLSNHPDMAEMIYGQALFPLAQPVELASGDEVRVDLRADMVGEDYVWSWRSRVCHQGQIERIKAKFEQSTFFGAPLSTTQLRKEASAFVPRLNEEGQLRALALSLMNGHRSLQQIADQLVERFPNRFSQSHDALKEVSELSRTFSEDS
ncbi:hypothetical protein BH18ACI4_BH18ACI4_06720 [soil metagenome]